MEGDNNNNISIFSFNSDIELDHKVCFNGPRSCFNLKLTITPQFCNMINNVLAHEREKQKRLMDNSVPPKPSNFSASSLTIGTWQKTSQREGDLVGKCYYKKKKLVWEILNGDRKSKIEIPFLNITAIKATIQDNEPDELIIELKEPPDFFVEAPPQPRKHTIWQPDADDFTENHALFCRRHVVKCRPGTLEKHYNLLLQSDSHLLEQSRKPFSTDKYPLFNMVAKMSRCISRGVSPVDLLVKRSFEDSNGCLQQRPDGSDEPNAPQTSVTGFNPSDENFATSALDWNRVGNIQEDNVLLPQRQGVVPPPSVVAPSPDLFETNNPMLVQSWLQTCQYNIGMTNSGFADNVSNKVAPLIMTSSPSTIVAPSSQHYETNTYHLLEESWLKTCQDNIGMNTLEPFDDMFNEDARPIMAMRCPKDNSLTPNH